MMYAYLISDTQLAYHRSLSNFTLPEVDILMVDVVASSYQLSVTARRLILLSELKDSVCVVTMGTHISIFRTLIPSQSR
jgi:hypothetical protein